LRHSFVAIVDVLIGLIPFPGTNSEEEDEDEEEEEEVNAAFRLAS
jgi:hypothetical protein